MATAKRRDASKPRKWPDLEEELEALRNVPSVFGREIGMSTKKGERHDRAYTPRGWKLEAGKLRQRPAERMRATASDVRMFRQVVRVLEMALGTRQRTTEAPVVSEADVAAAWIDAPLLKAVRRLYRDLYGFDYGDGEAWRWHLANELRRCARIRYQRRLRPGEGEEEPTPAEMLANVKAWTDTPAWLTANAIEAAIPKVNLGGKGGRSRGLTPEGAVAWMVRTKKSATRN